MAVLFSKCDSFQIVFVVLLGINGVLTFDGKFFTFTRISFTLLLSQFF